MLFNIFRGTGIKGIAGIEENYENKIIRPFLSITKEEINTYIIANSIPFVTDETNFCDDYTRNYIRLKVLPLVRSLFPEAETAIYRLSETAKMEDEFLNKLATKELVFEDGSFKISLGIEKALFTVRVFLRLKSLALKKIMKKPTLTLFTHLKIKRTLQKSLFQRV